MSAALWLASMIVLPSPRSPFKSCRMSATPRLSRPFMGSSRIMSRGFSMIACAIPRRCRMPSEYFPTGFFRAGSSPTRRIVCAISRVPIFFLSDASISRFFSPLYCSRNPGDSMMMPMSSGKSRLPPTSSPCTRIRPFDGNMKPQTHLNSTVFPLPLLPTTPWILPASKSCVTSVSTASPLKSL
jgi:hypothetical protein